MNPFIWSATIWIDFCSNIFKFFNKNTFLWHYTYFKCVVYKLIFDCICKLYFALFLFIVNKSFVMFQFFTLTNNGAYFCNKQCQCCQTSSVMYIQVYVFMNSLFELFLKIGSISQILYGVTHKYNMKQKHKFTCTGKHVVLVK